MYLTKEIILFFHKRQRIILPPERLSASNNNFVQISKLISSRDKDSAM
jgi:hypothetical protein